MPSTISSEARACSGRGNRGGGLGRKVGGSVGLSAWARWGTRPRRGYALPPPSSSVANPLTSQWFYAFSITPRAALPPNPANATASPFSAVPSARGTKRPAGSLDTDLNEYGVPNYIFGGGGDRGAKKGRGGAGGPPCVSRLFFAWGGADAGAQAGALYVQYLQREGALDPGVP